MKKLWLFAITLAMFSCKKEVKIDYAILSGKIENASSDKVMLYNKYDRNSKKELTLENGQFTDTVKTDKGNAFFLVNNKKTVSFFLSEGDELNLTYDAQKIDSTLTFTGTSSAINTYLTEKETNNKKLKIDIPELYALNETDFINRLLKIKTAQEDFLYNANDLPETFIKNETSNIDYEYLASISNYEVYHSYFGKIKDFKASDTISNKLKDLSFENEEDFKFSSNYRDLVANNFRQQASILVKTDSIDNDIAYLKTLATIKSNPIRNKLLFDNAQFGITYTNNLEDFYALYSKASTNEDNNIIITESYNKLKALSKGNASPQFTDYENNAGGTTSLKDLKGKYVYMDIWATWCGPCIAEVPSLKKTEKLYHGKNIEFVSISIDKEADHEKWKKMIIDKELGGIQLFADNNWESQFIEDYLIKGIPRFILLDPQGNIISANAPRPSSEKLVELFDELKI